MSVIGEAFVRVRPETTGFRGEAQRGILPATRSVARSMIGIFGGIAAGAAIGKFLFLDPIRSARDFQTQLNILQATVNGTNRQMDEARAMAVKLGADIHLPATSALDAADAMTELAKGGLNAAQSIRAARGVIELSTAANIDNATAAQYAANALNQFQLAAGRSGHVADLLANAANKSSGEVIDMADALTYAGTASHGAGQSIDVTVGAIAEMAQQGIIGSRAGSSFAQMLRSLQSPTAKGADVLKKLNIQLYDSKGNMLPLPQIAGQFSAALGDMTQKQKNQTLASLFGTRAIQAARIVLEGGRPALEKWTKAVSEQGGAQRLAEARTKGFGGAMQALKSQIETVQIQMGTAMLPVLEDVTRFMADKLPGAAKAAGDALSGMFDWIGRIRDAGNLAVAVHIAFEGVGTAVDGMLTALRRALFGAAGHMEPVFIPAQKIFVLQEKGASQGLFGALAATLRKQPWHAIGSEIAQGISKGFRFTAGAMGEMVKSLLSAVNANRGAIAETGILIVADMFTTLLDPMFWIKNWRTAAAVAFTALSLAFAPVKFVEALRGIPLIGPLLIRPLLALGRPLRGVAEGLMSVFGTSIVRGLERVFPAAAGAARGLLGSIVDAVRGLPIVMRALMAATRLRVTEVLTNLVARGAQLAARLVVGILRAMVALPMRILAIMDRLSGGTLGKLAGLAGRAAGAAVRIGENILRGIIGRLAGIPGRVGAALGKISSAIAGAASKAYGWAKAIGSNIVNGIISGLSGLFSRVSSAIAGNVGKAIDWAKGHVGSTAEEHAATQIGKPIIKGILKGIRDNQADIGNVLGQAVKTAIDSLNQKKPDYRKVWHDFAQSVMELFNAYTKRSLERFANQTKQGIDKFNKQIAALQKEAKKLTPSEKALALMTAQDEAKARADALVAARAGLVAAQAGGDPAKIRLAQEAVLEAQAAIERFQTNADEKAKEREIKRQRQHYAQLRAEQRKHLILMEKQQRKQLREQIRRDARLLRTQGETSGGRDTLHLIQRLIRAIERMEKRDERNRNAGIHVDRVVVQGGDTKKLLRDLNRAAARA